MDDAALVSGTAGLRRGPLGGGGREQDRALTCVVDPDPRSVRGDGEESEPLGICRVPPPSPALKSYRSWKRIVPEGKDTFFK